MISSALPRVPLADLTEATRRLDEAERARARALHAWEVSDEPYPLNAAVALEAAERDLRLARTHLAALHDALVAAAPAEDDEAPVDEKAWGSH